jgi:hypothetical protein
MQPGSGGYEQTNYGQESYRLPERTQEEPKRIGSRTPKLKRGANSSFIKDGDNVIEVEPMNVPSNRHLGSGKKK